MEAWKQLMIHVSIFRTPACVQVIIQEYVALHRSADALYDFYDDPKRGTPIRPPSRKAR